MEDLCATCGHTKAMHGPPHPETGHVHCLVHAEPGNRGPMCDCIEFVASIVPVDAEAVP